MTCRIATLGSGVTAIVCDGRTGGWRVDFALCPWCCVKGDKPVRVLSVLIYSGYGGSDFICGTCGQAWSDDGECWYRKMSEDDRDANIAKVAAVPDPKCWDCHDTGERAHPLAEESDPCHCGAKAEGRE